MLFCEHLGNAISQDGWPLYTLGEAYAFPQGTLVARRAIKRSVYLYCCWHTFQRAS